MSGLEQRIAGRKVKSAAEIRALVGSRPRAGKVVMCHGVFDIVHPGHIRHLIYAKGKGDVLVASLTADRHVTKADHRPFVPQDLRAINLAALEVVDYVLVDTNASPLSNIALIEPDLFAKGYEYAGAASGRTDEERAAVEAYGGEMMFTPGDVVYSSSRLIESARPSLAADKLAALLAAEGLSFVDLRRVLGSIAGLRVHVVGDTIVDRRVNCAVIGSGSKTPTLSVRRLDAESFVGGAAIVAQHLRAAGAEVSFSTVLGDDAPAAFVLDRLAAAGVTCDPVIDRARPTTVKEVVVSSGHSLLKIDTVDNRPVGVPVMRELVGRIHDERAHVVVFSDFRHGIFNRDTIGPLKAAIRDRVFKVADSQVASRWGNILDFTGFDLITPNEREARFALGDQDSVVRPLGSELYARAGCGALILKLGERGLMTFRVEDADGRWPAFFAIDSFADAVVDPVGSGDALLAYAAPALYASGNAVCASVLGSFAAALECECAGNTPISHADVARKLDQVEAQVAYR